MSVMETHSVLVDGFSTIPALFWQRVTTRGPKVAMREKDRGIWKAYTWADYGAAARAIGMGLVSLGFEPGERGAILSENNKEWLFCDLGIICAGGVSTGIYPTDSPAQLEYLINDSDARVLFVEDEEQLDKILAVRERTPCLKHIVVFDMEGLRSFKDAQVMALERLMELGRAHDAANPGVWEQRMGLAKPHDTAVIVYTSGTTGPPKGCMILHRNYYAMAAVVLELADYLHEGDVCLLYLPLAHNFGRLVHLAGPLAGFTIAFEPDPYSVATALTEVRPTVLPSVPRIYEKVHSAVGSAFADATGAKARLVAWALSVGRRVGELRRTGRPVPRSLAVQHRLADRLVYAKVKERLGGRLRLPISGGAPLAREVAELFDALDIRIMEGYGLTECTSAATTNVPGAYRYGTVGRALPGFELRLADDGELLMRSETIFAGYHRDPEATATVLDADGWLRTGDVASIDDEGYVTITDRKKDILVTAGGKNVAPQNIENDLKTSRWISQAIVVGDRRPYVAALVTLDPAEIERWAQEQGVEADLAVLAHDPRVRALVQSAVDDVNRDRTRFEQIKRFAILPRDFTVDDGEVTPSLKLRRRVCIEHFADEVERLYTDPSDATSAPA